MDGCGLLALANMSLREGGFLYEIKKFSISKLLVALELPEYDQYLEMISLKLVFFLLYVVININGVPVWFAGSWG